MLAAGFFVVPSPSCTLGDFSFRPVACVAGVGFSDVSTGELPATVVPQHATTGGNRGGIGKQSLDCPTRCVGHTSLKPMRSCVDTRWYVPVMHHDVCDKLTTSDTI